jgi:electron transfer flavoprotein beta subunit
VKHTPDTAELPRISAEEVTAGEVKATMVINPWDEFAVEEAILLSERFGADTVALTMGASTAVDALKHALAMGIGDATLIDYTAMDRGDMWATAEVLSAAVKAQGDVDLVLTGQQSVDESSGAVHVGVACKLGVPLLAGVSAIVDIADSAITVERSVDGGTETVQAPLPVVVSVTKEINEPRYPSFMGIRKANRATIPVTYGADLGVTSIACRTRWTNIRKPEERRTEVTIIEGDSLEEKAVRLVDVLMAEKVI